MATRPGALDDVAVTAAVYPVHRRGHTSVLNVLVRAEKEDQKFTLGNQLGDHNPEVSAKESGAPDGIKLVDGRNNKAYLAATTADGSCLCSPISTLAYLDQATQVWVSVTFAAVPASVSAVDVLIPRFGTVPGVPVV